MPIDADHETAQSHWSGPAPRLAGLTVILEAVADTIAVTAPDTGFSLDPRRRLGISRSAVTTTPHQERR